MKDDKKVTQEEAEVSDVTNESVEEVSSEDDPEIDLLKKEVEENKQKYLRVLADYQNLERRVQEQRRELLLAAGREILLRILPILDTLQLAKKHSEDKALDATIQQFLTILQAENVTPIETLGKEFDPSLMECITTTAGKDNMVLEELRAGYKLNDRVLRPAEVVVGDGSEEKN